MPLHLPTLMAGLASAAAGLAFLVLRKRFLLRMKESVERFRSAVGRTREPGGVLTRFLIHALFPFLGALFLLLGAALVYRSLHGVNNF
jgi:hypothetical protein